MNCTRLKSIEDSPSTKQRKSKSLLEIFFISNDFVAFRIIIKFLLSNCFLFFLRCFESENENEGFYLTQMGTRTIASLAMVAKNTKSQYSSDIQMQIYRPNIGLTSGVESLSTLIGKSTKVTKHRAEDYWNDQYKKCEKLCTHQYYRGKCNNTLAGFYCDVS